MIKGVAVFLTVLCIGGWPWRGVGAGFSGALSQVANSIFAHVTFRGGLRAELVPLPPNSPRRPTDVVRADTTVVLRSPSTGGEAKIGISLRRDAYLPLLGFLALVLAVPSDVRRKTRVMAVGLVIVVAVAVASIYLLVVHLLNQRLAPGASSWSSEMSSFLFERWLLPWGNRFIAPLLLGVGLMLSPCPSRRRQNVRVSDARGAAAA